MPRYNENGLTDQQQAFADNYLADSDRNQREAYRKAYPGKKTDATIDTNASKLLSRPKVNAYVEKRLKELMAPLHHNQETVIQGLSFISNADIRDFFDKHGNVKPPQDLTEACGKAVAGVKVTENEDGTKTYDYKLIDKNGAYRMLGQNLQMFVEVFRGNIATTHEAALDDLDDGEDSGKK